MKERRKRRMEQKGTTSTNTALRGPTGTAPAFIPGVSASVAPKGPEQYRYGKYFVAFNDGTGDWGIYRLVDFLNPALTAKGVDNIWDCATEDDAVEFMVALDAIQDAANATATK